MDQPLDIMDKVDRTRLDIMDKVDWTRLDITDKMDWTRLDTVMDKIHLLLCMLQTGYLPLPTQPHWILFFRNLIQVQLESFPISQQVSLEVIPLRVPHLEKAANLFQGSYFQLHCLMEELNP